MIVPSIASRRLTWPSIMLRHVGAVASSKSAMNPSAPEFRALMTILRSVGPVISTQRWARSGGRGRDLPIGGANGLGLGPEVQRPAGRQLGAPPHSGLQQLLPARAELALQGADELEGIGREHGVKGAGTLAAELEVHRRSHVKPIIPRAA